MNQLQIVLLSGNYQLLKETIRRKIPFFAASGHNSYTRAAYVFLQDMNNLETNNRTVFDFFNDGNFVTRRTDRFWAGLPDDLIIEQVIYLNKLNYVYLFIQILVSTVAHEKP